MVFESLVTAILNRFLGAYVENLDASKTNFAIWSGNVALNDLRLKASSLDELNLSVKLKFGFLEKLALKIPWQNLYTEPVVAEVEGLYLLAVPNVGIKYNAEKEEKMAIDAKLAELTRIELAKKQAVTAVQEDTFTERMLSQVIKNLQVTIRNIHIRYEDCFSNVERRFATGLTLHQLCFQTTDEDWKPCILKELKKIIYKATEMKSLSIYWNCSCQLLSNLDDFQQLKVAMEKGIAKEGYTPEEFYYILAPISIGAYLKLNTKPETDGTNFSVPKFFVAIEMEQLTLNIHKYQYQGILEFLEAQEQFALNATYRKFRPYGISYRGHAKECQRIDLSKLFMLKNCHGKKLVVDVHVGAQWVCSVTVCRWKFAIDSVLEMDVKRRARNWSWKHIKQHRELLKEYRAAWVEKLTNKNISAEKVAKIQLAEKELDLFNLNIARQAAEIEIRRRGLKLIEEQGGWVSWVKSFWNSDQKQEQQNDLTDITTQFEKAMTKEEKAKLYEAIGYQENQAPTVYPKEFVDIDIRFKLGCFTVVVLDTNETGLEGEVGVFKITGVGSAQDVAERSIVAPATSSNGASDFKQLKFAYETNPLDGSCDENLMLRSQPLLVTYHAETINRLMVALRPPESVRLKQLTNAAMMKYEDIKKISTAGLHRAMQMRKRFKIDLKVLPTTLNIPAFGDISRAKSMLVMDFGMLRIKSEEFKDKSTLHVDELYKKSEDERYRILMNDGYDAMNVTLKSLKILFVEKDANGRFDLQKAEALLEPTGIGILIRTAIADDVSIPNATILYVQILCLRNQIKGTLPDLTFNISERYLVQLLKLVSSIPMPPADERNQTLQMWQEDEHKYGSVRMQAPSEVSIDDELTVSSEGKSTDSTTGSSSLSDYNEQVDFQIIFILNQIALDVYREEDKASKYFSLRVADVGMELRTRPLDMVIQCHVGTVEMLHHGYTGTRKQALLEQYCFVNVLSLTVDDNSPLYLIRKGPSSQHLLHLDYRQADRENPFFASTFHSTEQWIELKVQPLCINARQEALVDMQNFMHRLKDEIATLPAVAVPKIATPSKHAPAAQIIIPSSKSKSSSQKDSKKSKKVDTVLFSMLRLRTRVSGLRVVLATSNGPISEIAVEGLKVEMVQMIEKTKYFVRLESVAIDHFDSHSDYKRILSVVGDEMFRLECVQFNIPAESKRLDLLSQVEMMLTIRFSQLRFIFLYYWLSRVLNWISPFQNAAQRTASYAGSALQEGARTAVDLLQDQDITRIKLDIVIDAPVIIVPANTQSSRALMVNFGQLIVKNQFRFCNALSVDGVSTLFDDINLKLDQMKICRVLLDKDCWTLTRERQLLKPITFVLAVQRNLSFATVKSIPSVSVRGQLPDIELGFTSDDYAVMMEILNENLAELEPGPDLSVTGGSSTTNNSSGKDDAGAVKSSVLVDVELVETSVAGEASNQSTGNVAGGKVAGPPPYSSSSSSLSSSSSDSKVQVELGFEIDHLSAVLSKCAKRGDAVAKLDEEICPADPLAGLQLRSIKLQARLFTNGCMSASVVVQGLEVEDQRAGDIGIRKLLDCMPGMQKSAVLTADYKTSVAAPRIALVNLNKFFLCLSVDFLLELSSFFTWTPTDRFADSLAERALAQSTNRAKRSAAEQIPAGVQPPADLLQINTQINGIQVILVEDCRRPDSTNAMFLEFQASVDVDSTADEMNMQGSVENLEMYSDQFAMFQRGMYKYPILSPCRMAVNYKKSLNEESAKVIMPELKLRVSPAAIYHLSTTLAEMTRNKAEVVVSTVEQILAPVDVWSEKLVTSQGFWFLKEKDDIDYGCECDELMIADDENSERSLKKTQRLVFDIPSVFVMLEADSGRRTVPMIYLHCGMEGEVYDWSSLLWISSTVTCIAWYFNDRNNAWEPVLEPIVEKMTPRPWKFRALVNQSDPFDSKDGQEEEQLSPKARMTVSISSDEVLELTAFSAAAHRRLEAKVDSSKPLEPYLLINRLGLPIMIGSTEHFEVPADFINKPLLHGESVSLIGKVDTSCLGALELQDATPSMYLHIQIPELNVTRILDVSHAGLRLYHIQVRATADRKWKFLVDVSTSMGNRVIVLRSAVMFYNFLPFDVEIYQKTDSNFRDAILLKADGGCASPALSDVNQGNTEFCVKPIDDSYDVSIRGINWPVLENDSRSVLLECCFGHSGVLYIQASAEHVSCLSESSNVLKQSHDVFNIHLQAPLVFLNLLHIQVLLSVETVEPCEKITLSSSESRSLFHIHPSKSKVKLTLFDSKNAKLRKSCTLDLSSTLNEVNVLSFRAFEDDPELNLGLMKAEDNSKCVLSLFSPIWLVNSTGLPLECKEARSNCGRTFQLPVQSDVVPVMLSLSRKKFFEKKNARLKVCDSEWSSAFPLDTVGSAGRITCAHSKLKSYDVSVTSRLSEFGLTKICSFVPFYMVKNVSMFDIEVRQVDEDSWIRVNVNQCVGIWPNQNRPLIYCARYVGTVEESQHFLITDTAEMFATIANQHIGVYVSCNVSENSAIVTLEKYQQGMIPLLIINALQSYDLLYGQEASNNEPKVLKRGMCVYYAWESLLLKRSLAWTCGNAKDIWTLQSTFGEVFPDRDVACYYVAFSDGSQRVLLFTDDATVCTVARQVYDLEIADKEFLISFQGVGLSLVNDRIGHEIAYVSLKRLLFLASVFLTLNNLIGFLFQAYCLFTCSTGVIWEQKKKRFRAFSVKYCSLLEAAYMKYLNDLRTKQRVDSCFQVHKLLVDFADMKVLKPDQREIRRSFQSGFSLQYRVSPHDVQVHLKINSFQIDNQIPGCVFNTVFSRAPIPKSIASESVPKPFIEVTFIMRNANETIPYVQYFKILIQEMTLKADNGFLESLMDFFNASSVDKEDTDKEKFERDWNFVQQDLGAYALTASSDEQKAFYNLLHFSPLKLHLSYSQGGAAATEGETQSIFQTHILGLLLKSIGVTMTEVQDVVFKLPYFERDCVFLGKQALFNEVYNHYFKQAVKQIYVLVLGLDVIGNPFGLMRDLSTGVEQLFYEPIQGAIEGPEEFAEGLALGMRSLLGHTVGGAAGAVSKITGTLGKGIAALTFDADYQQKRQRMMNRRTGDLSGVAQSGTGALLEVFDGVTGVFTKPIEGAREEGALGFAKGLGKGLIGAVTRPITGVVDFASASLEALKKATEVLEEVKPTRPSRYIALDRIIRPYTFYEAEGNKLLMDLEKGKYRTTDSYVVHQPLTERNDQFLMATDQRILHIMISDFTGSFTVTWSIPYSEMKGQPKMDTLKLTIQCKEKSSKWLSSKKNEVSGKSVFFLDESSLLCFYEKMSEVLLSSKSE
ncbi:Vacuolar protein sorting-associated protein 13A [Trichinella pseudospiralis]|uniref:Vacuolar protein sorting-associated protein 13A n=1 Tax=Trichinella pseudospiralis TaxID=6337 RepID=A0A0V0XRJ2_TRIPS|nr:Vacuolar protein sorting-associated protein 13A [Trichinella pseudospiralis]